MVALVDWLGYRGHCHQMAAPSRRAADSGYTVGRHHRQHCSPTISTMYGLGIFAGRQAAGHGRSRSNGAPADVATCIQIDQLKGHGGEVAVFSADGQMLASGSKDKKAMLWNIQPHRALTMMSNVTSRPVFSPDSRLVAASVGQNKVVAWDVATFEEKALFAGAFDAVAFSPDNRSIMTRGTNYFLRTYDVATQAVRQTISHGPSAMTNSHAALSPDGAILATGWPDGTLTFCDAKTGASIAPVSRAYSNVF